MIRWKFILLVNLGSQYKGVSYRNCIIFFGLLIPYNSSFSQFISLSWAQPCFSTWYEIHDIHHECSFLVFFVSKLSINHFFSFTNILLDMWAIKSVKCILYLNYLTFPVAWAVLRPSDLGHSPGLRPKFFAIFYINPYEFLI